MNNDHGKNNDADFGGVRSSHAQEKVTRRRTSGTWIKSFTHEKRSMVGGQRIQEMRTISEADYKNYVEREACP